MNNNDLRTKTSPSSHAGCMLFLVYLLLQVAFLAQSQEKNTQTPSPSDIPELKGVLHAIPGGGMGIRLGNGTLVKSGQASRIAELEKGGLKVTFPDNGEFISIQPLDVVLKLEVQGVKQFEMVFEPNALAKINGRKKRTLTVEIKEGSAQAMSMTMPDGAVAVIGKGAEVSFNWFLDETYYFWRF